MEHRDSYPICLWIDERLALGAVDLPALLRELGDHIEACPGCRWRIGQLLVRLISGGHVAALASGDSITRTRPPPSN